VVTTFMNVKSASISRRPATAEPMVEASFDDFLGAQIRRTRRRSSSSR